MLFPSVVSSLNQNWWLTMLLVQKKRIMNVLCGGWKGKFLNITRQMTKPFLLSPCRTWLVFYFLFFSLKTAWSCLTLVLLQRLLGTQTAKLILHSWRIKIRNMNLALQTRMLLYWNYDSDFFFRHYWNGKQFLFL